MVPAEWKKVHENNYSLLNIQSTDAIKCLGAFVIGEGGDANVVSFMNYMGYTREFLTILDKTFDSFNEENELVDGDPSDKEYFSTSLVHNLFHGFYAPLSLYKFFIFLQMLCSQQDTQESYRM